MIDLIAIVEEVQEKTEITLKSGDHKSFQKAILKDDTGSIVVTFWGSDIEKIVFKQGDVVCFKSFLVKDYQGKSLNCTKSSDISYDIPNDSKYQDILRLKTENAGLPSLNLTEI